MDFKEQAEQICLNPTWRKFLHHRKIAPKQEPCVSCEHWEKVLIEAYNAGQKAAEIKAAESMAKCVREFTEMLNNSLADIINEAKARSLSLQEKEK